MMRFWGYNLALMIIFFSFGAKAQQTETLQQALAHAYENNAELEAQRAKLRALDEQVPLALSGYRPSINVSADAGSGYGEIADGGALANSARLSPHSVGVSVIQSVFRGFRTQAEVESADAKVLAGRAALQHAEQILLFETAKAYLDTVQAQAVLQLTQNNQQVLTQQLAATKSRFDVGEATKTDISQAQARLNAALSQRIQAEGSLVTSRALYARLVGQEPAMLIPPLLHLDYPQTLQQAISLAEENHPLIQIAKYGQEQAQADVTSAKSRLMPAIDLIGSVWRGWDQSVMVPNRQDSAEIRARITIPLYQSGSDYAKTRAAHQAVTQRRLELEDARGKAKEGALTAWQNLLTAQSLINADDAAVAASELALYGVQEESKAGTRTVLDILNAQQELLSAKVNLVSAKHDEALAILQVKASVGKLTAKELHLPVRIYDPHAYYDKVRGKWIGVGGD